MAAAELVRQGWHLTDEGINALGNKGSVDSIIKKALDTDLKDIGAAWLSEDINRGRLDYIEGPSVLQLSKLRIVSAPKDNVESQTAPKIYRLSLTDGHVTCSAVTLEPVKGLGLNTPPGSKLLLSGTVEVETNFLLLTAKNTSLLGGRVSSLADSWELKKTLAKQFQTRANRGAGGPPPFVPFGNKITSELLPPPRKDNFKSLSGNKEKKTPEGETEFQQQRQAALNQALQAKGSSRGGKTFGGGKVLVNDRDVARIVEMGFTPDEATSALKASGGNVNEAINSLLSGGQRFRGGDRGKPATRGFDSDGRGEGRRRGRDRDQENDGEDLVNTRPSGPATLFDFLQTKIPTKDESKKSSKSSDVRIPSSQSSSALSVSNDSSFKFNKDNTSDRPPRRPLTSEPPSSSGPPQAHSNYKDGPVSYSDTYRKGKGENNFSYRGQQQQQQQNVPPRFAKMGRGDGQRGGGGSGRNDGGGGYRGGGERYDGSRDGGYDSRVDHYSDYNQTPLKENNQNMEGKGVKNFSGSSKDGKTQGYQEQTQQNERRYYNNDQQSNDGKKRLDNQGIDASRNSFREEGSGRDNDSYRQQNYGNNQYRNSSRSDNRDGSSQPYKSQSNNRSYNQQPAVMPAPYRQQPPQESQVLPVHGKQGYDDRQYPSNLPLNVGDSCVARYWEDDKFYPAVIEAIAGNGRTAVVTFVEYGTQEEVGVEDIQLLQQPGWAYQVPTSVYGVPNMSTSLPDPASFHGAPTYVPPMEFTRGGSYYNNGGRRQENNDRRRPYYQHLNQRPP